MADDILLNSGSGGDTVAADDVGGVKHQRVKISLGADGAAADALSGAGTVGTGVQRVTLASDDPAVAALEILDNIVSGNEAQVDIVASLPAGTNNIGDVDVLSIVPGTGATALGKPEDGAHTSGDTGVMMLAVRRDTPAAGSGTDGDYSTLNVGSGGRLYTSATIDAALPAGTNAIGKLAENSGVDIGNVDITSIVPGTSTTSLGKAEDQAFLTTDVGVMSLAVRASSPANTSGSNGDYEPLQVDGGLLWSRVRGLQTPNGDSVLDDTANAVKMILVDPTTGSAITAGSEYVEGDTDATISGIAVMFEDTGDALRVPSAATPLPITSITLTPGTGASNLGKAEDAVHGTGDVGVMILGRHIATPTNSAAAGDYCTIDVGPEGGLWTSPTPSATGGLSVTTNLDVDESEDDIKTSAGAVYGWYITNRATSARYVKFYNATAANTTVGTTAPHFVLPLPGHADTYIAANVLGAMGIKFDTAICIAATTGFANNDTGAPGANDVIATIFFK